MAVKFAISSDMFGFLEKEKALLSFSSCSSLLFALLGISLGIWASSLVIVFDGAYSLVSLLLTLISLGSLALKKHPFFNSNPHSAAMIEPAVVAFKGFAISLMCGFSFVSALVAIRQGGREVDTGLALVFGFINVVGCVLTYWVLSRSAKQSALLDAEAKQWLMDCVISAAVMIGFVIAVMLNKFGFADWAVYADPVMVVVASMYFIWVPLKMTSKALKQLNQIHCVEVSY
ncbi:cation transporter [Agarivorans sp. MS3-6]|uniref:cation transporter n=1 Tax=Agarivorans sp. TSD2052 TaxID=2937286 RepID=UPI00200D8583|nr:cation transporter [Agarivorans sp. TSD2052]UPW17317.1 cation transporter [Agarivorans sp. TSD2052]